MSQVRIGCIGCGQMGSALLRGLAERDDLLFKIFDLDKEKMSALGGVLSERSMAESAVQAAQWAEIIVLAIKPQQLPALLRQLSGGLNSEQLLVSIAAGFSIEQIKKYAAVPVARVMPNTGLLVKRALFGICFDDQTLSDVQKRRLLDLLAPLGKTFILPESMFDPFTAVAGAGPAYVYYLMESLSEAAVSLGFSRIQAAEMIPELITSAGLIAAGGRHEFTLLREMVESPAGATIAATIHLERQAVRAAFIDAVQAACRRAGQLSG